MSSVFLSHNSKDKPWVRKLAERLTLDGITVWLDEAELNIGDSLIEKISAGIQDMKFVAAIISKNSIQSSWVQKEINLAMSKEIAGRTVTVLPLLIDNCTLPASLADKLYANFTSPENYEVEYTKLLRALGVTKKSSTKKSNNITKKNIMPGINQPTNDVLNIKIIGVVKDRTVQDQEYAGLQHYYLQLSQRPPSGWDDFFNESRRFPRHSMWRKAWIEGDCVVVKCALDELSRYHLKDLKHDVKTANSKYKEAKDYEQEQREYEKQQQEIAINKRDNVLDQLDFD